MTKEELRRKIAELTGWKLEHRHYPEVFGGVEVNFRTPDWIAIRPDGSEVDLQCSDLHSKVAFWEIVPDWPDDAGAALGLMVFGCLFCSLTFEPDEKIGDWECSSTHGTPGGYDEVVIVKYADTPEMAICEWYVAARASEAVTHG